MNLNDVLPVFSRWFMAKHSGSSKAVEPDRRRFLASGAVATGAMAGGLALGYGAFFRCAGEYLYPSEEGTAWMFVTDAASLAPGQAFSFVSPMGVPVVITRRSGEQGAGNKEQEAGSTEQEAAAADFLALSSVCPHLGCRVHWEPQNDRFFCPCHLGAFDPEGRPTAGPPLSANQSLPEYPLRVENGLLYINMPVKPIDETTYRRVVQADAERAGASSLPTGAEDRPARLNSQTGPRTGEPA
jgi:Rieske Fe-S protein